MEKAFTFVRDIAAFWRNPGEIPIKAAVVIGLLLHISFLLSLSTGHWDSYFHAGMKDEAKGVDFFAVYVTGYQLLDYESIYPVKKALVNGKRKYVLKEKLPGDDERRIRAAPFRYLPTAAYLAVLMNLVAPWTAYNLWIILNVILFFTCIFMLGFHFRSVKAMHVAAAMYFFFTPWYPEILWGQRSFLQSFFILCMLLSISSGRPVRAAGWWIASVLWKMNTAICLPAFIRWRRWKSIGWLLIAATVTCGPYFIIHPKDIGKFFAMNFRPPDMAYSGNFGLQGLLADILMLYGHDNCSAARITATISTIVIILLICLIATILANRARFVECVCLWFTSFFLVYQDVWEHHFVMLLPVITFLYLKRPGRFLWFAWFLIALPTAYGLFHDNFQSILDTGMPVNGVGATYFWNVWFYTAIKPIGMLMLFGYCISVTISRRVHRPD